MKAHEITDWPEHIVFLGQGNVATMMQNGGSNAELHGDDKMHFIAFGCMLPSITDTETSKTDRQERLATALGVSSRYIDGAPIDHWSASATPVNGIFDVTITKQGVCRIATPDELGNQIATAFTIKGAGWEYDTVAIRWTIERNL